MAKNYRLTICCVDINPGTPHRVIKVRVAKPNFIRKVMLTALLLLRRFTWANRVQYPFVDGVVEELKNEHFDLIVANDVETLPLAFRLKKSDSKLIFDAHEYSPRQFEDRLWWRILFQPLNVFLCTKYIPQTDGMITVSKSLADEYEKHFGKKPIVITNAANYSDLKPVKTTPGTIKLVHQGSVGRSRKIELIIGMMEFLPQHFTLDLMLVSFAGSNTEYMNELRALAANDSRVRFIDPVPMDQVIPALQKFDIGIILAPPLNFNYIYGLPNKLYDYVQARIGVLTSPTIEIARVVEEHRLGIGGDDFTSEGMARKFATHTEEHVHQFKLQSHAVAHELSAEKNEMIFDQLVRDVLHAQSVR